MKHEILFKSFTSHSSVKLFIILLCCMACLIVYNIIFVYNSPERKNCLNMIRARMSFLYVVGMIISPHASVMLKAFLLMRTFITWAKKSQCLHNHIKPWVLKAFSDARLNIAWVALFMDKTNSRIPLPRTQDASLGLVEQSGGMTEYAIDPETGQKGIVGSIIANSDNLTKDNYYDPENRLFNLSYSKTLYEFLCSGYGYVTPGMLDNAADPSRPGMFYWLNVAANVDYHHYLVDFIVYKWGESPRREGGVASMFNRTIPITHELINELSGLKVSVAAFLNLPPCDTIVLAPRGVEDNDTKYKILERLVDEHNNLPFKDPMKELLYRNGYRFARKHNMLHLVRPEVDSDVD